MKREGAAGAKPAGAVSPDRLHALDSLRGLAALVVVFQHVYLMWPQASVGTPLWVSFSPLRLLINGHGAVIVFFVLSGYVLSLPFLSGRKLSYPDFLVRRFFRIYAPYALAIVVAALAFVIAAPPSGLGSAWFQGIWTGADATPLTLGQHLAMTGRRQDMWLNPITWSLVYELRISLILPLLLLLSRNLLAGILATVAAYVVSAYALLTTGAAHSLIDSERFGATLWLTLHYAPYFMLGILAARHHEALSRLIRRCGAPVTAGLFACALLLLCLPTEIHNPKVLALLGMDGQAQVLKFIPEALLGIGAALLIILIRAVGVAKSPFNPLRWAPVEWLGKVSYSLYLLHFPIVVLLFRNLLGEAPFAMIAGLAIACSLAAAALFYWAVEEPFMAIGRRASTRLRQKPA